MNESENKENNELPENTETETLTEETVSEEGESVSTFSKAFEWVEMFAVYFAIGLFIILMFFRHSPVVGTSMVPTLSNGDVLIVSQFMYTPKAGDIVVCQSETYGLETPLVKRVIAVGGQTVRIDYENWSVTVDGVTLNEDYINRPVTPDIEGYIPTSMKSSDWLPSEFTVPEGYVFVMGDNRNGSTDSRSSSVGFIDERYVMGKVAVKILPFKDFKIY